MTSEITTALDFLSTMDIGVQKYDVAAARRELTALSDQLEFYTNALTAIAAEDDLVKANEAAFSIHALRRVQGIAQYALAKTFTPGG